MIILATTGWLVSLGWILLGVVLGAVGGFFISRWYFKRELAKNPPINEQMIRVMYAQMGRKPSEAQIRQIMNSVNKSR
ncbi:MAG TPA: YneF family protein [Bacilli bacterium]|nr:YneF family protein [Bacilli bacterium]